jgi:hypothetical protein
MRTASARVRAARKRLEKQCRKFLSDGSQPFSKEREREWCSLFEEWEEAMTAKQEAAKAYWKAEGFDMV